MAELTIIGISGKMYSGKSTLARALTRWDDRYSINRLADALKTDLFDLIHRVQEPERLEWSKDDKIVWIDGNKSFLRIMLQQYGTDVMRRLYGQDVWVDRLLHDLGASGQRLVVDDARFPNEIDGLRRVAPRGVRSYMIRLEITPEEQDRRAVQIKGAPMTDAERSHPSETALDDMPPGYFDLYIDATKDKQSVIADAVGNLLSGGMDFKATDKTSTRHTTWQTA